MSELKTLKDITLEPNAFLKGGVWEDEENQECISKKALKQETIKWVKEDFEEYQMKSASQIIFAWMERLNITEEDLK